MKTSKFDLAEIGSRMKLARDALSLGRAAFVEQFGLNIRTYQKNEAGLNEAGICLAAIFIRAGINANWLLTGEGPMFLADLMPPVVHAPINMGVMAVVMQGAVGLVGQGMSVEKACRLAVETYQRAMDTGEITPTGIG